jgi:hypothetical protein
MAASSDAQRGPAAERERDGEAGEAEHEDEPAVLARAARKAGNSIRRKTCALRMPSWLARRQLSPGTASSPASKVRAAKGMLKKTWAINMPPRP